MAARHPFIMENMIKYIQCLPAGLVAEGIIIMNEKYYETAFSSVFVSAFSVFSPFSVCVPWIRLRISFVMPECTFCARTSIKLKV